MMKYFTDSLAGLFVLIIAFSYSIFFILQTGIGIQTTGSELKYFSGGLTVVSVGLFLFDGGSINNILRRNSMLVCALVTLLFYFTGILYGLPNRHYDSYFLAMGVNFIPGVLTAVWMLQYDNMLEKLERGLIPFIVLYSVILAKVVFTANIGLNMDQTFSETVMSYQSISYYSAYALGFTLYVVTSDHYPLVLRRVMLAIGAVQLLMAIMGGGRGAFILCVILLFYFGSKQMSWKKLIAVAMIVLAGFYIISLFFSENPVFQLGFNRIFNFFNNTEAISHDIRWIRWHKALDSFYASPVIGHGLGSVFYEVGFYSHNIFTDILCEGGVILMCVVAVVLYRFVRDSFYLIRCDNRYEIILLIFLCSFIMCLFSGYYLAETGIWLSITYILGKTYIIENEEYA